MSIKFYKDYLHNKTVERMGIPGKKYCKVCGKKLGVLNVSHKGICDSCWKQGKREKGDLIGVSAKYLDGHLLLPNPLAGELRIKEDCIVFQSKEYIMIIPFKDIIVKEITQGTAEDLNYQSFWSAMAYFAGHGPVATFRKEYSYFVIPFYENGIKQKPRFSIMDKKRMENFFKIFCEKITQITPKKTKRKLKEVSREALEILKLRYAKGEITKREFERMKRDLEYGSD